ncbi:SHOCT domain-containing protein [Rubrivivax gelatinosus]|uniref:Putative oligomerization/nucleic acid binding protein n=1 Tax=Rubrivivax gelatinosus TaxID=28068 RepID=A0A4R2LYR0_RUBGE|nr:SHOCT domain-containing protein [Rubrivivax gelatinosus]TCO98770.1 putative oligomerization/nucleic acid binding protein [Rubrivivax gelatinosus]
MRVFPSGAWRPVCSAALLACAASIAFAQSSTGRAERFLRDSSADRVVSTVYADTHEYVRIERAEPGAAPSLHPAVLPSEQLRAALSPLRNAAKDEELFSEDELKTLVPALAKALAQAQPGQDVAFAVTGRHGGFGPLVPRTVTTGRVFRTADGLQLIVGMVWAQFEGQFRATGVRIAFEPGRRAAPVDAGVRIDAPNGRKLRSDWVSVLVAPPPAAAPAAPAPAAAAAPGAAPAAVPAPVPAAPGAAAPAPQRPRDAGFFEEQEQRLRTLKRLHDNGLITDEEYRQKRYEVLQQL